MLPTKQNSWDVIVVGAGLAGLSAAIYLGRARRRTLLVDSGHSLAEWEPDVQNYLGFPDGVSGEDLLKRGKIQAKRYGAVFAKDEIRNAGREDGIFVLQGKSKTYRATRVLLATGLLHLPPQIPRVKECLGHSMFFCKDCDGVRVQGKRIAIVGRNNEAVEYALAMVLYSPCVAIVTNGKCPEWDETHAAWLKEYEIPFYTTAIEDVECHNKGMIRKLVFETGPALVADALFTTRGDIYHNKLAKSLGAKLDEEGQVIVDRCLRTSVRGLYASGCVTPANCQMIIAAGQGAAAAQAINRDLFEESLKDHRLRRYREKQIQCNQTEPIVHGQ
jgi:thioredoxin reductase (NADPH)